MLKTKITTISVAILMIILLSCCERPEQQQLKQREHKTTSLRAPAFPLITVDPYTSAWSEYDNLYDGPVRHWTGKVHSLIGAIRVDGEVYRFMGKEELPLKAIIPMATSEAWGASFTHKKPTAGWEQSNYNATSWKTGKAAFGSAGMSGVNTIWNDMDKEIWVRRDFKLPDLDAGSEYFLMYSHDDDFELYLNGKQIVKTGDAAKTDVLLKIDRSMLNPKSGNVIAAHCLNRRGLAYLDFGIFTDNGQKDSFAKTAQQDSVRLSATQTLYSFTCGPIALELTFISPLLPDQLDLLSRPINYVTYSIKSRDENPHEVQIYFEMTPQWAVNDITQEVVITKDTTGSVQFIKAGTKAQQILERSGDNVRIDWGYAYLAADDSPTARLGIGEYIEAKSAFIARGKTVAGNDTQSVKMSDTMMAMGYSRDLDKVSNEPVSGYVMIGYDDITSIQYFGNNLKALWTHDGTIGMGNILTNAVAEKEKIIEQCIDFDNKVWNETFAAGGKEYADLCVLAYRQAVTAHKLTKDSTGNILFLSKENFSNGSIGTVDVTYPSAPLFLKYNPELLKGMMNPIFYFSESGKWKKPFAAHDVGTYPKANGQTYGGDMPVEESGNMLILTAAIAKKDGNANYAKAHWRVLTTWANYLVKEGLNPDNQLCTDDFAGHFAHNTNLSIKAIMAIASYAMLAEMLDKKDTAALYKNDAARMAIEWEQMANDGDHYRLTFDKPGTWSQKYNMVWDKLLGFNIFSKDIAEKELAYYLTKQNTYGVPLDNRKTYTKSDWIIWTATLSDDQRTFQKFITPVHAYVTNTPTRVPMSDWYETVDGKQVGFQARSVVGGYFIKTLEKDFKEN